MKLLKQVLYGLALIFTSCADVIEPDISSKKIEIKSPANGVIMQSLTPTFSWNSLDGATKYNIQIAYPSFDSVKVLIDTTIKNTTYTKQLTSGKFEWKVRAVNTNYFGVFTDIRKFSIDSSLNITNQIVSLTSPTQNSGEYSTNLTQTLTWQALPIAKSYNVKITDADNATTIKYGITDTKYVATFTKEGTYSWTVQAIDADFTSNKFAEISTFYIDKTSPSVSITNASTDSLNVKTSDTLTFTWASSDAKKLIGDSIEFFAADSNIVSSTYGSLFISPTEKKYKLIKPSTVGTYWFRIVAVDAAWNTTRSKKRKFKVITI